MKTRKRFVMLGGSVLALLVLVGVGIFGRSPNRDLTSAALSAAKDGLPQTLDDLNAWYVEPPAGQNGAQVYAKALSALQLGTTTSLPLLGQGRLPPPGAPIPAPMKTGLATLVNPNAEALRFFAQGAEHERCRYPVDLTYGYEARFAHLPELKNAALFLELCAVYHVETRQAEQAANDVLMGLGLAHSLADEPSLLSQLMRADAMAATVAALERVLNRIALPPSASRQLTERFKKMEAEEARGSGFNRAMVAEHVLALTTMASPSKLLQIMAGPSVKMSAEQREQTTKRLKDDRQLNVEREFLETSFRQLMEARQDPFPARLKTDDLMRQRMAAAKDKQLLTVAFFLPGLAGRTATEAECLARVRLGWTALALEEYRAAHGGRYPAALSELMPDHLTAVLVDPFDGQPLRFHKSTSGYALYSVGPDLKDNNAAPKKGKDGDIVFAVVAGIRAKP